MTRIDNYITALQLASEEVRSVLSEPKLCGDMIEELGHSIADRYWTLAIGDGRGEWDGCPHQLALSDLLDSEELVWWRDTKLDVWYGLKGMAPVGGLGDNSPSVVLIESFLEKVGNLIGKPIYTPEGEYTYLNRDVPGDVGWNIPYIGVLEIEVNAKKNSEYQEFRCVHIEGAKIEIIDYDFACGTGADEPDWEAEWPGPTPEQVATELRRIMTI